MPALSDPNERVLAVLLAGTFALSFLGTWFMVRRGRRLFLDTPTARSAHSEPTPRGGGIAFVTAFFLAALAYGFFARTDLRADCRWIPIAVLPLVLVGVVDDLRGLSPLLRFAAQMLTACLIVIVLGHPLPTFIAQIGVPATALLVLLVTIPIAAAINFANFMDGLDGLVAGMALVQLCFLGAYLDVPPAWLIVAALLGFLFWNWPRAKIFMGDTGSTFLGAAPVLVGILSNAEPAKVIAAWAVTAPLHVDALLTLLRRAARGANIFEAHREHLYQRLQRGGWSHQRVTLTYMATTLVAALLIAKCNLAGAAAALVLTVALYLLGDWRARRALVTRTA